ncbi:MAG: hypothetical protein HWD58_15405 [Bacteroidota bacterium]|nr:MAG: hypothetical protein HWD58_15405 [Bacteroidota bacterium]
MTKQFYKKTTLNLEAGWWSDANTVQNRSIQRYTDAEESQGLVSHQNTNTNNNQTPSLRLKLEHKPDSLKQITFREACVLRIRADRMCSMLKIPCC